MTIPEAEDATDVSSTIAAAATIPEDDAPAVIANAIENVDTLSPGELTVVAASLDSLTGDERADAIEAVSALPADQQETINNAITDFNNGV